MLDKCLIEGKELICNLGKKAIEEILKEDGQNLNLMNINEFIGETYFYLVYGITIKYSSIQKENIWVGITKLLENTLDLMNFVA